LVRAEELEFNQHCASTRRTWIYPALAPVQGSKSKATKITHNHPGIRMRAPQHSPWNRFPQLSMVRLLATQSKNLCVLIPTLKKKQREIVF
jgi:hypothetical protein